MKLPKAHKPEILAQWAKENKVHKWEHYWKSYAPSEQAKRRQRALRDYNRKKAAAEYRR